MSCKRCAELEARCEDLEAYIRELRDDRNRDIMRALEGAQMQIESYRRINESLLNQLAKPLMLQPAPPIIITDANRIVPTASEEHEL